MRVALYEIGHRDDVPTEVAIDEAIELAKRYCGTDAPAFVNGVLGAAVRATQGAAGSAAASPARGPSMAETDRLREIASRLEQITAALSDDATGDERAAELSREAADLASEAVEETNRLMRGADAG